MSLQVAKYCRTLLKKCAWQRYPKVRLPLRLAKVRAQDILRSNSDPLKHLRDFEQLYIQTDYCLELRDYGNLNDEVHVARCTSQPESEIRAWVTKRLKKLADD